MEPNDEWSLWYANTGTWQYQFIDSYATLEGAEEAAHRLSTRAQDVEETYEICQLVDEKWVTQFVVEWRLTIMLPEEAESDG